MSQAWSHNQLLWGSAERLFMPYARNAIAVSPMMRHLRSLIGLPTSDDERERMLLQFVRRAAAIVVFELTVTRWPQPIDFIFRVCRLKTRNAVGQRRERILELPFPHTPIPQGIARRYPIQSVCAMERVRGNQSLSAYLPSTAPSEGSPGSATSAPGNISRAKGRRSE